MGISKDMLGVKGDECNCGRRATVRHCIACGSTRLYTRQNRYHKMLSGEVKLVEKQTRCQSCGQEFIEEERQFCEAPPVGQELAKQRVRVLAQAREQGEFLRPEDQKVADAIAQVQEQIQRETQKLNEIPQETPKEVELNIDREAFDVADRALRLEWAQRKLSGQDVGIPVEEYVERRLKGELFNQ